MDSQAINIMKDFKNACEQETASYSLFRVPEEKKIKTNAFTCITSRNFLEYWHKYNTCKQ